VIPGTNPGFDVKHLSALYRSLVPAPIEFLEYLGVEIPYNSHRAIDSLSPLNFDSNPNKEEACEDLVAMVSDLAQYFNLLNVQKLFVFPWKHTVEYTEVSTLSEQELSMPFILRSMALR
jgi:hypothetical protein